MHCGLFPCSFQFKAKPFNPKIVTLKGRLGVPTFERKSLTHPVSPMLTADVKPKKSQEPAKREEFRAKPLPKDILEGVKVDTFRLYKNSFTCMDNNYVMEVI